MNLLYKIKNEPLAFIKTKIFVLYNQAVYIIIMLDKYYDNTNWNTTSERRIPAAEI